uniref:Probable beta-glucosidase G n=1 Tax=Mucochytrium quahogii TaxID=96639 RepID=A0A7S2RZD8_9STRA|mmetsp:Transcript_18079/g.29315  ORF Transcript_18079/g.29315 Transcript_18079/m.29315 type:complete len:707 (+) Transcript_18079:69-2189(+)
MKQARKGGGVCHTCAVAACAVWAVLMYKLLLDTCAYMRAESVPGVDELTLEEKIRLLHGTGSKCGYTGEVAGVERVGIPALRSNDGPQGFRGRKGRSTAYPCSLSMASSFSRTDVYAWGREISKEFSEKGANIMLGPGLNVARVPNNGRNFEYLSGEDPHLGSVLASYSIRGIQSVDGMIATMKHFVCNNFETHRQTVNVVVDETTLNELYYPPFRAAVKAGVLSVMCSYNKINGHYACENEGTLVKTLKREWGFKGFVMSDWSATHSTQQALMSGLDSEMPTGKYFGKNLQNLVEGNHSLLPFVDNAVERILYALKQANLLGGSGGGCRTNVDVTSSIRRSLAREFAIAGTILLRNYNGVLPLGKDTRVALVGKQAKLRRISSGFGSGHVDPGKRAVTVYTGLLSAIKQHGGNVSSLFQYTDGSNANETTTVVSSVDVSIVVLSTNSMEALDRSSIAYPDDQLSLLDQVIHTAREHNRRVVVVAVAPGPVLMPWADKVDGILLLFLPGEQFGNAVADVLFGHAEPKGRLPLTIPFEDKQMQFSPRQYPGENLTAVYSEGLLNGYRWYDFHGVNPLYPFGYGLTYTMFKYLGMTILHSRDSTWSVQVEVQNIGDRHGHEVAQLYLSRSNCDCTNKYLRPPNRLVGFQKVRLAPNQTRQVRMTVRFEDLAEWSSANHSWIFPDKCCSYSIALGSSIRDIHLTETITF